MTQQELQALKTSTHDTPDTFVALKTPLSIGQKLLTTQTQTLEENEVKTDTANVAKKPLTSSTIVFVPSTQGVRFKIHFLFRILM